MSLSDCPKCWETPCRCGGNATVYDDQQTELYRLRDRVEELDSLLKDRNNTIKTLTLKFKDLRLAYENLMCKEKK